MNANELIEELEDTGSFFEDALYLKSAALLRKQQAEIEALKNRELTDEEIWKVASEYFVGKSDFVYGFARAILRKAQENE